MPLSVLGLAVLTLLAFMLTGQYAPGAHPDVYDRLGIVPAWLTSGALQPAEIAMAAFGHVFVHYGAPHLAMNGLALFQAAPFLARRIGDLRFLILYFTAALGGALAFVLINPDSEIGMVGASGAICGVFAAFFLSVRPSPRAALADPQVRNAMLGFLGINVVLMAFLPLPIAWEAHLGGFITGALAYPLLAPRRRVRGPWG
jgi:membrane associated rhomboid family serine protease